MTFKKIFAHNPDLVVSFLNALLPLKEGEEITDIKYLTPELVPDNPLKKLSIVDVRCQDKCGRQFIVEMQMVWFPDFQQRVLFNASKAYVCQLNRKERYSLLQPVYALSLMNDIFLPDVPGFYHPYRMVLDGHTDKVIEGLQLIFIELPKFTPHTITEKKMTALWLRFLTEIDEKTKAAPPELLKNPEVKKALDIVRESAFDKDELDSYDKFWDAIRVEKGLYEGGVKEGYEEGHKEGIKKGMEEGVKKGMEEGVKRGMEEGVKRGMEKSLKQVARNLKQQHLPVESIAAATGLTVEEIELL